MQEEIPERLKQHLVQLTYSELKDGINNISNGTGCIIDLDKSSNYYYLLTAAHNFYPKNEKIDFLQEKNQIIHFTQEKTLKIITTNDICYTKFDKIYHTGLDLCIGAIHKQDLANIEIQTINLHNGIFEDSNNYHLLGYPKFLAYDGGYEIARFHLYYDINQDYSKTRHFHAHRVLFNNADIPNEADSLKGLSGAGVFYRNNLDELELVGLHIQSRSSSIFVCLNFSDNLDNINETIDKINEDFKGNLPYFAVKNHLIFDNLKIDINEISYDQLKKQLAYKSDENQLEKKQETDELYSNFKLQQHKTGKKLAELAIYYHENKSYKLSSIYFAKSIKVNPAYKKYFLDARTQRSKKQDVIEDIISNSIYLDFSEQLQALEDLYSIHEESSDTNQSQFTIIRILSLILFIKSKEKQVDQKIIDRESFYLEQYEKNINNQYSYFSSHTKNNTLSENGFRDLADIFDSHDNYQKSIFYYKVALEIIKRNQDVDKIKKIDNINNKIANENGLLEKSQIKEVDLFKIDHDAFLLVEKLFSAIDNKIEQEANDIIKQVLEYKTTLEKISNNLHDLTQKANSNSLLLNNFNPQIQDIKDQTKLLNEKLDNKILFPTIENQIRAIQEFTTATPPRKETRLSPKTLAMLLIPIALFLL